MDAEVASVAIRFDPDHKPDEGGWGLVDKLGNKLTEPKYWFVKKIDEDLYLVDVTPGLKKNAIHKDGKLIFKENFQTLYDYRNGYFIVGNTIAKTKDNPTRYPKGMLHVSGRVVLKIEYDDIIWDEKTKDELYIKRKGHIGFAKARIEDFVRVEFDVTMDSLWNGTRNTVCDGCIFSNGIDIEGNGCGKLFKKSFRERAVSGYCEYRKGTAAKPSVYERRRIEYWREEMRKSSPLREPMALLRKFVAERLDGDVDKLKDFDLRLLKDDAEFAGIPDAVCIMTFVDVYGRQLFDSHGRLALRSSKILNESFWGTTIVEDDYMMFHQYKHTEEQKQAVRECAKLCNTMGNLWFDPAPLISYKQNRYYFDETLKNLCDALGHYNYEPRKKDDFLNAYIHSGDIMLIYDLKLEYFKDENGFVKKVFDGTNFNFHTTPASDFFKILEQYMRVCKEFLPKRTERIVEEIKGMLER